MECAGGVRPELQVPALRVLPLQEEGTHTSNGGEELQAAWRSPALPSATGCPSEWSRSL